MKALTERQAANLGDVRSGLAIAALVAIGVGLRLDPVPALALLTAAAGLLGCAIVVKSARISMANVPRLMGIIPWAGLALGIAVFVSQQGNVAILYGRADFTSWGLLTVALVVSGFILFISRDSSCWAFAVFLLTFFLIQLLVLDVSRATMVDRPFVDVTYFQVEASNALFSGVNPFSMRFIDWFSGPTGAAIYGPGVSIDGILQFGFPYPPLSLLIVAPFQAVFADFRIALAVAWVLIAVMIASMGPRGRSRRVAVLFLLLAPASQITAIGYTEPIVIALGLGVVVVDRFRPRWSPYLLGLFIAAKQYVFVASPAYLLLIPRPWSFRVVARAAVQSLASLLVVTVPLAAWNISEFARSVVFLQFRQPARPDAMTITAQVMSNFGLVPPIVLILLPVAAAIAAVWVSLRYAPHGRQGYALATAFIFLAFFMFAKQGFPNYYILVMAFAAAAGSLTRVDAA